MTPPTFTIDAKPDQDFAARGRPFMLTARLRQVRHVAAPFACTLVQVAADGKETRTPMPQRGDRNGVFTYSATVTPAADFRYRVEASPDSSPDYAIETIQPVDLAADSPEITTRPPAYAADTVDSDVADGLVDATLLQNGTVQFDCKFTRPAVAAYLDWTTPEGTIQKDGVKALAPTTTRLELGPDGTTGTATLPVVASGKYRLRLVAERGIETAFPEHGVAVKPDLPPEVKKFAGRDERRWPL